MSILIYAVFLFGFVNVGVLGNISEACNKYKVVPNEIPKAPEKSLQVVYSDDSTVDEGNELVILSVEKEPSEVTWDADPDTLYTLVMIDADAGFTNTLKLHALHWLVVNILGSAVKEGDTVTPYLFPLPPPGSDFHRYVFLVYKQDDEIDISILDDPIHVTRTPFNVTDFAAKQGLGDPIYGNFFRTKTINLGL